MVLLVGSTHSNMAEACLLPLRVMHIVPFSGTHLVYVGIKQVVAVCSQTLFKYSIAGPPERVRALPAGEPGSHCFLKKQHSFTATPLQTEPI